MLRADRAPSAMENSGEQLLDVLQRLEIQYGPIRGCHRREQRGRCQPGLELFAGWLVHQCEMTQAPATFPERAGSAYEEWAELAAVDGSGAGEPESKASIGGVIFSERICLPARRLRGSPIAMALLKP